MDNVMDYIFVHLDNILVARETKEEHKIHLEEIHEGLQQQRLELHLEKCIYFATSVEFPPLRRA